MSCWSTGCNIGVTSTGDGETPWYPPGRVYIVEPTGPIEDVPNLTDRRSSDALVTKSRGRWCNSVTKAIPARHHATLPSPLSAEC